jgi:hypothetical protein
MIVVKCEQPNDGLGKVVKATAVNAMQNVSSFEGEMADEDFHSIFGLGKRAQARKDAKVASKNKARETKAEAKLTKAQAKVGEADAKKMASDASKEAVKGDVAFADAIKQSAPVQAIQGMSTTTKILIGVGGFLLIGAIGFGVYFMSKKKK